MAMTLDEINTKIEALLETPEVDYKIGDKEFKSSQKLDQLFKARAHLIKYPDADTADIQTMHFNMNVNEFGNEVGEYET